MLIGGALVIAIVKLNLNYKKSIRSRKRKPKINDCIFFAPTVGQCKSIKSNTKDYCGSLICSYCSYNKLVNYIDSAQHHIDVCVYLLTSEEICASLIKLLKSNVYVRIIVDKQMSEEAASGKVVIFRKECVPIKVVETTQIMHNKFVIIDQEIVITGSCNWTMQGLGGNYENAVITNNAEIVRKFMQYFEDLWNEQHAMY